MKRLFKVGLSVLLVFSMTFITGFESEAGTSKTLISSQSVIHTHTGTANQSTANGCYTTASSVQATCTVSKVVSNTSSWGCSYCPGTVSHTHYTGNHSECGASSYNYKRNRCGSCGRNYDEGSDFSAGTHTYTKTVYTLGCGKNNATVGTVSLSKAVSDKYILSIDVSGVTPVSYSWSTGSRTNTAEVTSNGTYTVSVVVKEGAVKSTKNFSYNVTDYDTTPPQISSVERFSERVTHMDVIVNATDNYGVVDYKLEK